MFTIKTILVPIDCAEETTTAIDCALALAREFDASVVVVHAYEIPL